MQPPPEHECFETFTYPRFVDGENWVDMIVQDLTDTIEHSKAEKRLLHVMLEGPGDVKFMHDMARDYLGTFYGPIQEKRSSEGKSLDLPGVDQSTLGWVPLLQEGLQSALAYFAAENETNCEVIGTPTCTPHLYVINPCKPGEILYVAVIPALHLVHDHQDHAGGDQGNNNGEIHNHDGTPLHDDRDHIHDEDGQ